MTLCVFDRPPPITLDEQIAGIEHELIRKQHVYPKMLAEGRLRQATADRKIAVLQAALTTLRSVLRRELRQECCIPHLGKIS